jgi:DNA-binding MurR/RpiR family transcriptional regulator
VADSETSGAIVSRIQRHYEELPPSERRIANLILDFPGEIAGYSATELAQLAGVSKAAATRLVQRLGYASYEEARRSARDAQKWGSPLYLLDKEIAPAGLDSQLKVHLERDVENMVRTFGGLDAGRLDQIVDRLASARRVWLMGYRNSHYLAAYARWQFIQVRDDVHLLPLGGETLAEYLASMREDDLLVAIGFRRRLPELRRAMNTAANAGVAILYLTDPTVRGTAQAATWTLRCEVRGAGLFDSYPAAMSLLQFLSVAMVRKTGEAGRARLKNIENIHEDLREFV